MAIYFSKELLKDWDGRLVLLTYSGIGVAVYDFKSDDKSDNTSIHEEIDAAMKNHVAAYDYTLDWKEYVYSLGAGKQITWKANKYIGDR